MRKHRILQFAILAWLAILPLHATEQAYVKRGVPEHHGGAWIERSEIAISVREGGRLILRADAGSVTITPAAGGRVEGQVVLRCHTGNEAEARRIFSNYELSARLLEAGGAYITGESSGGGRHSRSFGVDFVLRVPQRFNVDVETQGGDISIENALQGQARLTTAGGDIHTVDVTGPARIETAGGNITLGKMGNAVEARTAGGSIRVDNVNGAAVLETSGGEIVTGQVGGALRAETAGGDVVVAGAAEQVVAQTAGGQIQIGPSGGSVRAETAGGSIRLQGARGRVVAETAGGSIDLLQVAGAVRASTAAGRILAQWLPDVRTFGASQLETSMGDVYVYLPLNLALTIDAAIDAAAGHQIVSDFPLNIMGTKEAFCDRTIRGHGTLNGGGQVLRIRTVSGNIEIRKLDSRALQELNAREQANWQHWEEHRAEKDRHRQAREQERRNRKLERDDDNDNE
jgi:DUF4097 and DUF4098 domain-containing protein YvlB